MKVHFLIFSILMMPLLFLAVIPTFVSADSSGSGCCTFQNPWTGSYTECRTYSFPDQAACNAYGSKGDAICSEESGGWPGTFSVQQQCSGTGGGGEDEGISQEERQRREKEREEKLRKEASDKAEEKIQKVLNEAEEKAREEYEVSQREYERLENVRQEKAAETFEPLFGRKSGEGISKNGYPRGSYLAEDPGNFQLTFADGKVELINIETGQYANFGGIGVHVGEEMVFPPINPSGLSKKSISGPGKRPGTTSRYTAKFTGAENWLEANVKDLKDPKTGEDLVGFEIKIEENAPLDLTPVSLEIEEDGQKIGEVPVQFDVEEGSQFDVGTKITNYKLAEDLKRCYKKPDEACCSSFEIYDLVPACEDPSSYQEETGIPSECLEFLEKTSEEEQILKPENIPEKCKPFAATALAANETAKALESGEVFYDEEGNKLGFFKTIFIKSYLGIYKLFH